MLVICHMEMNKVAAASTAEAEADPIWSSY